MVSTGAGRPVTPALAEWCSSAGVCRHQVRLQHYWPKLTPEEREAQRGQATYPRPHRTSSEQAPPLPVDPAGMGTLYIWKKKKELHWEIEILEV